ncbi:hypothetical protein [Ferroacidibacillus organovorans]|uniref:Uncharacterized protein n=1 Tax=Ferroacidibacillus organovorans TaxID=1765683 RepID=A0A853KB49_9BACL|nr:hypothetical protein [Ferroacidibacillus organovorans]KYP81018.1 hypothetical protein AYJ22_09205 [Ferroacidibacillus organovorans]OAG94272.1 hypothetical protein AYW79_05940 [Ferroacidibacillus organovorans]
MTKKFRTALAALPVLSLLLVSGSAFAEVMHPLYDNLLLPQARGNVHAELRAIHHKLRMNDEKGRIAVLDVFVTPNGKHYFIGKIELSHEKTTLYFINRTLFASLADMRTAIADKPDFELIGHTLDVYAGIIRVSLH